MAEKRMTPEQLVRWLQSQPPLDEEFETIEDRPPEPVDFGRGDERGWLRLGDRLEVKMEHARIGQDPEVMFGKPVIRGTRITVEMILRLLGAGQDVKEILEAYPGLHHEDILAAQSFAADYLASERSVAAE